MGAEKVELANHRVVAVAQGDHLVALVGKRDARVVVILADLRVTVVDDAGRDQLVTRMREGRQHVVPALGDLVAEMVDDDLLAGGTHVVGQHFSRARS